MMKSTLLIGLALTAAAPAAASAASRSDLGQMRVEYTSSVRDNGKLYLVGRDALSGKRFRFAVSKTGFVRGRVGDQEVAFHVSQEAREREMKRASANSSS